MFTHFLLSNKLLLVWYIYRCADHFVLLRNKSICTTTHISTIQGEKAHWTVTVVALNNGEWIHVYLILIYTCVLI